LASGLPSWANAPVTGVTSIATAGTVNGITLTGGPITSTGTITLGGTLDLSAPPTIGNTTPNTGRFTTLTVDDNATFGSSNTDTVTFTARINSDFDPATDNAYDLGRTGHEWRNLFITGTANIDSLVADTADINAGTIDNTVIGGTTPLAGTFTTLRVNSTISLNGSTGTANYLLQSNGASAPSWADPASLTVGTATTATNATNIGITDDTTTNATMYPVWVTTTTGNLPAKTASTKFSFNPSTGTLSATVFSGAGTSLTGTASSLTAGTASTANALNTSNNYQVNSIGVGTAGSGTAGEIRATNNITAYYSSDIKFKENVRQIDNATNKAIEIGGKYFDWTDEYIKNKGGADGYFVRKSDIGVIAQDVQKVLPDAVRTREDGTLAVDYQKLVSLAFAAIAELKAEIDTLKYPKTGI
jgi:hypothetical protein